MAGAGCPGDRPGWKESQTRAPEIPAQASRGQQSSSGGERILSQYPCLLTLRLGWCVLNVLPYYFHTGFLPVWTAFLDSKAHVLCPLYCGLLPHLNVCILCGTGVSPGLSWGHSQHFLSALQQASVDMQITPASSPGLACPLVFLLSDVVCS